jgi:hypothetical protein|tara:strand:+ start:17661 stop:17825 length:165 start_codon:yes stop_codon:yes gene_type:complete
MDADATLCDARRCAGAAIHVDDGRARGRDADDDDDARDDEASARDGDDDARDER